MDIPQDILRDIPRTYHGHTTDILRDILRDTVQTPYRHRTDIVQFVVVQPLSKALADQSIATLVPHGKSIPKKNTIKAQFPPPPPIWVPTWVYICTIVSGSGSYRRHSGHPSTGCSTGAAGSPSTARGAGSRRGSAHTVPPGSRTQCWPWVIEDKKSGNNKF